MVEFDLLSGHTLSRYTCPYFFPPPRGEEESQYFLIPSQFHIWKFRLFFLWPPTGACCTVNRRILRFLLPPTFPISCLARYVPDLPPLLTFLVNVFPHFSRMQGGSLATEAFDISPFVPPLIFLLQAFPPLMSVVRNPADPPCSTERQDTHPSICTAVPLIVPGP